MRYRNPAVVLSGVMLNLLTFIVDFYRRSPASLSDHTLRRILCAEVYVMVVVGSAFIVYVIYSFIVSIVIQILPKQCGTRWFLAFCCLPFRLQSYFVLKGAQCGTDGESAQNGNAPYCWYSTVWRTAITRRCYLKWGISGRLLGAFQPPCVFDGFVNGFAVST